jgi:hypothetical protein
MFSAKVLRSNDFFVKALRNDYRNWWLEWNDYNNHLSKLNYNKRLFLLLKFAIIIAFNDYNDYNGTILLERRALFSTNVRFNAAVFTYLPKLKLKLAYPLRLFKGKCIAQISKTLKSRVFIFSRTDGGKVGNHCSNRKLK